MSLTPCAVLLCELESKRPMMDCVRLGNACMLSSADLERLCCLGADERCAVEGECLVPMSTTQQ